MLKWLRRIILFLLLGAIVNVAVAWGCAYWLRFGWNGVNGQLGTVDWYRDIDRWHPSSGGSEPIGPSEYPGLVVSRWRRTGAERISSSMLNVGSGPPRINTVSPQDLLSPWANAILNVRKVDAQRVPHTGQEWEYWDSVADARGWPMLSLIGGIRRPTPGAYVYDERGKRISLTEQRLWFVPLDIPPGRYTTTDFRWLPLRPLWPGFAVNTLFYALSIALLIGGARSARRVIRIKRNLCPACGYPRGASPVCTECGEPLPVLNANRPESIASPH